MGAKRPRLGGGETSMGRNVRHSSLTVVVLPHSRGAPSQSWYSLTVVVLPDSGGTPPLHLNPASLCCRFPWSDRECLACTQTSSQAREVHPGLCVPRAPRRAWTSSPLPLSPLLVVVVELPATVTSTRRCREDPPDHAGAALQRKGLRVTKPSSQQIGATAAERPIPVWRVVGHDDFPGPYQLVRWLECELRLALQVDVSASGEFLLRGATEDAAATLQEVADGQPRGIVLSRRESSRRGVLVGYPPGLPLDPVLEHPLVVSAVRCSYGVGLERHLPTRQVRLTLRGLVPAALDLGCLGTFTVCRDIREPVRCYRCQAFGHYRRQCPRRQEVCGVCSGEHASRDCVRLLREGGERPVARCPNCGAGHHAWNRRCPARLRQIPGSTVPRQLQWKEAPLLPPRSTPQHPSTQSVPRNEDAAVTRRPCRRRRRKRPRRNRLLSPVGDVDEDARAPVMTRVPAPLAMAAVGGGLQPAVAPRHAAASQCRPLPSVVESGTQTEERLYTYGETDLLALLGSYEFLVSQEAVAARSRVSHQPALSYVRQALRDGHGPGVRLPTERPIAMPACQRRRGEGAWGLSYTGRAHIFQGLSYTGMAPYFQGLSYTGMAHISSGPELHWYGPIFSRA
ncbi:hypothetical protein GWK47_024982 [Chionoecetes opilio]|uniref:CCHC-type domain-containing protein n=1 Tax=Chionoecetes opilio TaxID=41210 RepID=A0A8J4XLW8_CHIOP|nr:hypothetical protein GWK47_024982 [Chionoecetes opilio]